MGKCARIEPGALISIDTESWLEQRTGGPLEDLTGALLDWAPRNRPDDVPHRAWPTTTRAWLRHNAFKPAEPELITHTGTRLDADLWVLRATTSHRGRLAVVGMHHGPPTVYADTSRDAGDWHDTDSIDVFCAAGHGWTWHTDHDLTDITGTPTTVVDVFGPDPDAPYTICLTCTAHHDGHRAEPCGCDRAPWILCPTCRRRCDVELTAW